MPNVIRWLKNNSFESEKRFRSKIESKEVDYQFKLDLKSEDLILKGLEHFDKTIFG